MYKYYLTPAEIAEKQKVTEFRHVTEDGKYILNNADLSSYPLDGAIAEGAVEISEEEAIRLINK